MDELEFKEIVQKAKELPEEEAFKLIEKNLKVRKGANLIRRYETIKSELNQETAPQFLQMCRKLGMTEIFEYSKYIWVANRDTPNYVLIPKVDLDNFIEALNKVRDLLKQPADSKRF